MECVPAQLCCVRIAFSIRIHVGKIGFGNIYLKKGGILFGKGGSDIQIIGFQGYTDRVCVNGLFGPDGLALQEDPNGMDLFGQSLLGFVGIGHELHYRRMCIAT
jgi:hypothetical protein